MLKTFGLGNYQYSRLPVGRHFDASRRLTKGPNCHGYEKRAAKRNGKVSPGSHIGQLTEPLFEKRDDLSNFFYHVFRILLGIGYFGPFLLGVADSSFLFVPIGNDLLIVALVARHHQNLWIYVLSGAAGSTVGVYFLDLVARAIGETGVQSITGKRRFEYLKRKAGQKAALFIALACLAPPPFPFTMLVATTSALGYPRKKILATVAVCRVIRFFILGLLAVKYGQSILRLINTPAFKWSVGAFGALCLIVSGFTIAKWVRTSRSRTRASV